MDNEASNAPRVGHAHDILMDDLIKNLLNENVA